MWVFCLLVYLCSICVPGAYEGQKRAPKLLGLELDGCESSENGPHSLAPCMLQLPTHPTTSTQKKQPRVTNLPKPPQPPQAFRTTTPTGYKELALCFLELVVQVTCCVAIRLY